MSVGSGWAKLLESRFDCLEGGGGGLPKIRVRIRSRVWINMPFQSAPSSYMYFSMYRSCRAPPTTHELSFPHAWVQMQISQAMFWLHVEFLNHHPAP